MATERMRHRVADGWDVLLAVCGKPITLSFPTEPTPQQLADEIARLEALEFEEVENQVVVMTEEVDNGL